MGFLDLSVIMKVQKGKILRKKVETDVQVNVLFIETYRNK